MYEGVVKNNYLYNGKELLDENADLGWLDYGFRNYDPQIGRFPQLDPLTDSYPFLTPYQYASCDPITNIDIDGLEGCPSVGGMTGYVGKAASAAGGASRIFNGISAIAKVASPIIAGLNLASNIVNTSSQKSIVKQQLAGNSINGEFTTGGTGNAGHGPIADGSTNVDLSSYDSEYLVRYWPVYNSPDAAAVGFSKFISEHLDADNQEYSSVIYQIVVGNKNYYSFTIPIQDANKDRRDSHSPGPDEIIKKGLLPKTKYQIYDVGFIHNHPYKNALILNRDFSPGDMNNIKYNGPVWYLLNIDGELERWGKTRKREIKIASGFEQDYKNPKLTNEFDYGGSQDLSEVDYYKVIKK